MMIWWLSDAEDDKDDDDHHDNDQDDDDDDDDHDDDIYQWHGFLAFLIMPAAGCSAFFWIAKRHVQLNLRFRLK